MAFKYDSRVMRVTDGDVIQRLIHPDVFAKLGLAGVAVEESALKCLAADGSTFTVPQAVTLAGGVERKEFTLPTGRVTIERDGLEVLAEVFRTSRTPAGGTTERKVLRCALRDRQLDGTPEASPLSAFPNTHEATNKLPHPDFKVAELSIYCYDPERYLPEGEMLDFIMRLDDYIYKRFDPELFFRLWTRAFEASNMAPWQPAPPLKGVAQHFVAAAGRLLTEQGYHRMDAVAGWFNVVIFFVERLDFTFTYGEHQAAFAALRAALSQLEGRIGRSLNLREQAWVVALQSIPAMFIPERLNLNCRWINTPTYTDYVARLHKDLNRFPPDPRVKTLALPRVFKTTPEVATECGALPQPPAPAAPAPGSSGTAAGS